MAITRRSWNQSEYKIHKNSSKTAIKFGSSIHHPFGCLMGLICTVYTLFSRMFPKISLQGGCFVGFIPGAPEGSSRIFFVFKLGSPGRTSDPWLTRRVTSKSHFSERPKEKYDHVTILHSQSLKKCHKFFENWFTNKDFMSENNFE